MSFIRYMKGILTITVRTKVQGMKLILITILQRLTKEQRLRARMMMITQITNQAIAVVMEIIVRKT